MYTRIVSSKLYLVHMVHVPGRGYRQEVLHKFKKGDDVLSIYEKLQAERPEIKWNLTREDIQKSLNNLKPSQRRLLQRKRKVERLLAEANAVAEKIGSSLDDFLDFKNRIN